MPTQKSFNDLGRYIKCAEELALIQYNHDMRPMAIEAWVEEKFLLIDVKYSSRWAALYEINLETEEIVLAQD